MAQPSVAQYFTSRKRAAIDEPVKSAARKVIILEKHVKADFEENAKMAIIFENKLAKGLSEKRVVSDKSTVAKKNLFIKTSQQLSSKPKINIEIATSKYDLADVVQKEESKFEKIAKPKAVISESVSSKKSVSLNEDKPTPDFSAIKEKLTRSEKLAALKASLSRFQQLDTRLKETEKKSDLKLQNFKSLELEIQLSPQKVQSPEKLYLSPKKNVSARKNLFSPKKSEASSSITIQSADILTKTFLTLPYKYRYLAEIFRSIDTVCQILYNRKETITFKKLKPAVEEMLKRNLYEKHLSQIKFIYPEAFELSVEKHKTFGMGVNKEQWELVIMPLIDKESMTSDVLLQRRRHLFNALIHKLKLYHQEFLRTLDPPINIPIEKITRWHPEFDIENVPDIEGAVIPQPPSEDKIVTGREVLEKAKLLIGSNKRLDIALEKYNAGTETKSEVEDIANPALRGIPKALLEKIRQKQAAKALESMTRTSAQEKEAEIYSRLPEIARLTRNLYVTEKKSVMPTEIVLEKLNNSFRSSMTKNELTEHLKLLSKEFPDWLIFHNIRNVSYMKLLKHSDLNLILKKLEEKIKEKSV